MGGNRREGTRPTRRQTTERPGGRAPGYAALAVLAAALFVAGPAFASAGAVGHPQSTCSAKITSVKGLSIKNLAATITIKGSCLGKNPTYVQVSSFYSSTATGEDSENCGTGSAPDLHIIEWGSSSASGDWSAGRISGSGGTCLYYNAIGLFYSSWSNSKIVIKGFGNQLSTGTSTSWLMTPSTPCAVVLFNPPSGTGYNYTMPAGTC